MMASAVWCALGATLLLGCGSPDSGGDASELSDGFLDAEAADAPAAFEVGPPPWGNYGRIYVDLVGHHAGQGTMIVGLTNLGSEPLAVPGFEVLDDPTQTFSVDPNQCTASLAPGERCGFYVTATVASYGEKTGTFSATIGTATTVVPLVATGFAFGRVVKDVDHRLDFGTVPVGATSASQTVTVTNIGSETFETGPATPTIVGPFEVSANGCTAALAPDESCTYDIVFKPTQGGYTVGMVLYWGLSVDTGGIGG